MPFTGRIEEIYAQHNSERKSIYKAGGSLQTVEIPEGASWELHVVTTADWPEVAPWATAITGRDGVTFGNARLHAVGAGSYDFGFNMGKMPGQTFHVGRIRFWKNQAYTNVPPPEGAR